MPEVKTAAELEANIKRMVGLHRDEPLPEPRKFSPQPQQQSDGEMSAFKKFVSSNVIEVAL